MSTSTISTRQLSQSSLFQRHTEALPLQVRARLSYKRAQAIGKLFGKCKGIYYTSRITVLNETPPALTAEDVANLSPKFWQIHRDQVVLPLDGAVAVLLTIQYNLCAGTMLMYAENQPAIKSILDRVLAFDVS